MHGTNRATRIALVWLVLPTLVLPRGAAAADDPRRAIDRFEPSERGSEWLANESLDLKGRSRVSLGYVLSFAHRPVVVESATGERERERGSARAPVKELAFLHLGGSIVLVDRLRLGVGLPLQLYAGGQTAVADGTVYPAPPKEGGIGDLRLAVDVRVFGEARSHGPLTGAVGVQVWAPTGQERQWASDGTFRARPRAMIAGETGALVWAAQVGLLVREQTEITALAAVGVRLGRTGVLGPEVFASTPAVAPFEKRDTPVEVLLGAHWLIEGTARVGGGVGSGIGDGIGAPAWRAVFALEWSPEVPPSRPAPRTLGRGGGPKTFDLPDTDGDGVPDNIDACKEEVGIKTDDLRTNGCPPDADDDGINDLRDACPTVRGIPTSDPETNGCPDRDPDRDGVLGELDACPDDAGPASVDPARNGCPKAFVRGARILTLEPFAWNAGTAVLVTNEENESLLTAILAATLKLPEVRKIRVEGHTDDRGDRRLGAARAKVVAEWLAAHGIDRARITSEGIGPERPVATNATEAGRAQNRRIELHLLP